MANKLQILGLMVDKTLSVENVAADAKAVGDAISELFIDFNDESAMELATELGLIDPVTDENGAIYTDKNGDILTL